MKSGKQTQEPALLRSLQIAFEPQGDGTHGLIWSRGGGFDSKICFIIYVLVKTQILPSASIHLWNGLPE